MKKINLIEWLWKTDSHEKQKPQRFARYAAMLIMLLTLGVGQMWAEGWICRSTGASGNQATKNIGDKLNSSGWDYTFTTNGGWDNGWVKVYVGTSTSSYTSVSASWVSDDGSNKNVKANIGNVTFDKSGKWYAVGVYKNNSSTVYTTTNSTWTNNTTFSMGSNSEPYWTVNPPAVSDFTGTPSGDGYVSGSGTEGDPYIMNCAGGNMTLTLSGSKAKTDANSRLEYKSGSNAWNTTTTRTVNSASATTTAASLTLKMRCYNTSASLSGTESSITIWYKKESSSTVSVSVTPAAGGSASRTPTTMGYYSGGTVTATPNTGYNFTRWDVTTGSGTIGSATTASTTFIPSSSSANVRATFTAKTITVTLDGNEGSDGEATVNYDADALTSITHASRAGYSLNGYFTASEDGSKVINADGSLNNVTDWVSGGYWKKATNCTLFAQWTENIVNYAVTYDVHSSGHGTLAAANTSTSAAISSGDEVVNGTGVTFTASPSTGYTVDGWFSNEACTSPIAGAGTGNTYSTTISAATSVYVKFKEKTWSVAFAAGTGGTVTTPAATPQTVGQLTGISIEATPGTGYTFNTWTITSGSGSFTSSATTNSNKFKPTAASTITASFNETMSTLSTSCHYDAGNPSYAAPTVSGSATKVGYSTTRTITATSAGTGYTFAGWTLTNCTRTDGGSQTATSITIRSNGDGADVSVVANYNEVLTQSTWIVAGGNKIVTTGTTWRTTADANNSMVKKTGHAAESVVYFTVPVTTVCSGDNNGNFQFKIYNTSTSKWYGLSADGDSYYLLKAEDGTEKSLVEGNKNIELRAYLTGNYEFKLDYSTSTPKLTVTWPVFNQVRISAASPSDDGNVGDYDLSDPVENVRSVKRTLKANTTYTFKIVYNSDWYGHGTGTFTRSNSTSSNSRTLITSSGNLTLTTDYAGDYTFRFNQSTKALSIDFPEAYKVTYSKGAVDGSSGNSCSAKDIDNGNASVTSNSTWVKKDHRVVMTAPTEDSGYTFDGWFNNNSSTGDAITTAKNCTITVASAETYYACYHENLTAITITTDGHGTITNPNPNNSPYNLGVATSQAINATASTGYHWNTWTTSGNAALGTTATTASNTAKGNGTEGGTGTVTATFTPNTYTVRFHRNGGTGDVVNQDFTYDAAQNLTANTYTRTGYTFAGWAESTSGAVVYADGVEVSNLTPENGATFHLYAKWTPNPYTVVLDKQTSAEGYGGNAGTVTNQTVTFDATPATVSGTMPSAANGYAFMGFYSATGGNGRLFIDPSGNWVTSAGDTISGGNWVKPAGITLYAYYKQAEITGITFTGGAVVAPSTSKTVTAVISPTPTGTTTVCWRVLYSNDNPMDPQPEFSSVSGNSVSFTAPATSGMYKMEAVLHLGSGCGGEELSTYVAPFQVAGDHEVTIQYLCGGEAIKASETVTARPLEWSDDITAPDIFGYTFARWVALDGVSIKDHANDTSTTATIQIKATYDGRLKAEYNQNQMIYFKNTLGWSNVYVNFHTGNAWNNTDNGSGSPKGVGNSSLSEKNRNNHMIQIGESDVYYYDYGAASIEPSLYISFTDQTRPSASEFWGANPGINVSYPANYADALSTDKSSENGFKAATPMFVPLSGVDPAAANVSATGKANYYNRGYWTTYTAGTGYTLEIYYDSDESSCIQSIPFTSADDLMPMKAVVDLEAGQTYRYQVRRGGTEDAGIYYGNTGTMTYSNHGAGTGWIMENTMDGGFKKAKITANAAGNYTFNLSYSPNASNEYRLRMEVDYPIADGDYRLIYKDNVQTKDIKSAIVTKANNSKDTVSFFIRPGSTPVLKIQQATVTGAGDITWGDLSDISSSVSSLSKDSVYNICLTMDGSGVPSVESVEAYTGNFYIRTNAAGASKWDNYRSSDHLMTYSEYSATNADYSHYFMAYVGNGTNVKFVVANDYAPNISDTVIVQTYRGGDASHVNGEGDIQADANVRFMWNRHNNGAYRAYLAEAKNDGSKFLVLRANSNIDLMDENGNALINSANSGEAGYNHKAPDNSMQFTDNENWIYETTVKIKPGAFLKLYANFHNADFYYKGENNNTFDEDNAIQLLGGSGDAEKIRVIYDFKTDRLVSAWMPTGDIDEVKEIYADVMFVREHQGDIEQLTFSKGEGETMGAITEIKTAYGVLRFNKWTINNKSKADGHAVLDPGASRYERDLFYVSFPFRVAMNEVFGFGTYGKHWIIEEYDGAARALNGFWADTPSYWRFVTDRKGKFFEPNQGYIIALDLDEMGESSEVWDNGVENVELYFPSYGEMGDITNAEVTYELPEHECTINRPTADGNRTIKDSHWNVMSVPTYVNTSNVTFSNTTWTATRPSFLYEWNMGDNSLTPRSGSGYTYHAMHAYIVQYAGDVTWTSTSVTPASAPNRNPDAPQDTEYRLELRQNDVAVDQAFVRMSDDEHVTTGFDFNYDLSKEFNKNKANIYTMVTTMMEDGPSVTQTAGNTLPLTEQTTVVPVGVIAKTTGDYTFALPEGTNGVGVTLIDNETGIRTPLSALDYTVNLSAGTYNERFVLEISPIHHMPTGIENSEVSRQKSDARKVMIDGILYIVKDGKMFDAQGKRLQ